jgi:hypothetical protein
MNEVKATKQVTEGQKALITELSENITAIMVVNLDWTEANTTAEAADSITLLKGIRNLLVEVKAMRKTGKLTPDQIEAIRAKISARPDMQWINAARRKLNHIKFS